MYARTITQDGFRWWARGGVLLVVLCMLAVAVTYNQSAVHWRANVSDSHYFAYCGWRVSQGAIPYLDVWDNKPPGTWWVNAVGFLLCGPGTGREILVCSIALVTAIVGFIGIARTLYHKSLWLVALLMAGALLTHIHYECGGNRTETFVVPCEILAVLGYLRWRCGGGWGWLVFGGLMGGAAPLFKQSGLGGLVACGIHLAVSQLWARLKADPEKISCRWWQPWLIGGAAVAIMPATAAVVLAAQGAFGEAYFAISGFNRAYFEVNDATWLRIRDAFEPYLIELPPLYDLFFLVVLGVLMRVFRQAVKKPHDAADTENRGGGMVAGTLVLWLWLPASTYLACVGPGRQPYHLATTLAPLGLLAIYPLHWLLRGRTLSDLLAARPSLAAILVGYVYLIVCMGGDSMAEARRCWATKSTWLALARDPPAAYEIQAAEVARLTEPDETVYVWGWSTGTYRFAYRHSPSRFSTLEKLGQVGKFANFIYEGAVADIRAAPPAVLVISTGDLEAMMSPPLDEFAQWLDGYYYDHGDFEGMHILRYVEPTEVDGPDMSQ